MSRPEVEGRKMTMPHFAFELGCILCLQEELEKTNPNEHLVNILNEAVRLDREFRDKTETKS